ncbi:flavodoxin [Brucepastera parasyntrophica]|uniref:flavodoxin n=1 Tax=Brucepastera parasyntrophica TaxID=2880008 RepID=UPI00210E0497|nr:flavodoxin [Brucepastera parasyntrophica]ULQ59543.1 flavodoxin [Brucepastera parasyntrophica]
MDKTAIIYWSGTGNTESMARFIETSLKEKGGEALLFEVSSAGSLDLNEYGKLLFGCPSMGDEVLEESEFEPYFASVESSLAGKKVGLFGSYGWGDGQWMRDWTDRVKKDGAIPFEEGLIVNDAPSGEECKDFGRRFADF